MRRETSKRYAVGAAGVLTAALIAGVIGSRSGTGSSGPLGHEARSTDTAASRSSTPVASRKRPGSAPSPRTPPSCMNSSQSHGCGPSFGEDCCASHVVPGGEFRRSYDGQLCQSSKAPASVSEFALDRFAVTVQRFRSFAEDGRGTRLAPPKPGSGSHPKIANSGWRARWNEQLEVDPAALRKGVASCKHATWNDPRRSETLPMNCVTWYEAFAFCAWDGGRLPTEAEWNYAAAGGSEQRVYPWSNPPESAVIGHDHAVYGEAAPHPVGSRSPLGDARWGHADMAGNVWNWTLDASTAADRLIPNLGADACSTAGYPVPCVDCAEVSEGPRLVRGGGFGIAAGALRTSIRRASPPSARHHVFGFRCARARGERHAARAGAPSPAARPGTHPPGPYGFEVGDVAPPLQFRVLVSEASEHLETRTLTAYRDPAGGDLVLAFHVPGDTDGAASWAARAPRPSESTRVLSVLVAPCIDGASPACKKSQVRGWPTGVDAVVFETWAAQLDVKHPVAMDASYPYVRSFSAFPAVVTVDRATLRVRARREGPLTANGTATDQTR